MGTLQYDKIKVVFLFFIFKWRKK